MNSYDDRKTYLIPTKCPLDGRPREVAILYVIRYHVHEDDHLNTRELIWSMCNYCDFCSANATCDECAARSHQWFVDNFQELHKTAIERLREAFPPHNS